MPESVHSAGTGHPDRRIDAVDWQKLVRRRLPDIDLRPESERAVVEELSELLADAWLSEQGGTPSSPASIEAWVAQQIPNGPALARFFADHASPAARPRARQSLGSESPGTGSLFSQDDSGRRGDFMSGWINDLRLAVRLLVHEPFFALMAVVTLAVGIGLNSAVFSVVNAMLFAPLPVEEPDRLVRVYSQQPGGFLEHGPISTLDYRDLGEQHGVFSSLAASNTAFFAYEQGETNEMIIGEMVSGNYFQTLGLTAAAGRLFGEAEDRPGAPEYVAVLSHATWQKRFDGAPEALGQVVRINGNPITIIGVAQPGFQGLAKGLAPEAWLPLELTGPLRILETFFPQEGEQDATRERRRRWLMVTGRMAPGVALATVNAGLENLGTRLAEAYPESNAGRTFAAFAAGKVRIMPGIDNALTTASLVLMVLVGLVLLIACTNVANMLLSRAADRRKEVATRLAMGASRSAIFRQLLAESLLLCIFGAGGGLLLALWSNRLLGALELPLAVNLDLGLAIDARVLAFTCVVAAGTALIFGLVPALDAGRTDLVAALRDKAGSSRGGSRLRKILVIAQVAVSMMLLVSAGLAARSLRNAHLLSPGFSPDGVAVATFAPQLQGYDREQVDAFYDQLVDRVEAMPGVETVSAASFLPLTFLRNTIAAVPTSQRAKPIDDWPELETAYVDRGYFAAMRIAVRRGRTIGESDTADSRAVTVVNETLARRFWPDQDPIGRRLWVDEDEDNALEVIGVVADGKYVTLGESPRPFFYQAMRQNGPDRRVLLARTTATVPSLLRAIHRSARELDPQITISDLQSLRSATSSALLLPRAGAAVFGLFGLLGLLLTAIGLYGLIAYSVSRRTHEIGIRVAMGACRHDILGMVVREGMTLTIVGAVIGLIAAAGLSHALSAILFGVEPTDLITFVSVAAFLLATTLVATWVPARRAARLDPQTALRYE